MTLSSRIKALEKMSAAGKRAAWRETFLTPVPPAFDAGLVARAIAYHWQEKAAGGLSRQELRQLASLAAKDMRIRSGKVAPMPKPGTWLSRTWHGEVHHVVVLEEGYEYRGERFSSLTAIAARITGAKWSGPRFFGLMSRRLGELGVTGSGR